MQLQQIPNFIRIQKRPISTNYTSCQMLASSIRHPAISSNLKSLKDRHHPHLQNQQLQQKHGGGYTRQRHILSLCQFISICLHQFLIDLDFRRCKSRRGNEFQRLISCQLSSQPQERFFEVVVGLCADVKVLQVLFAVEGDCFGFDFAVFDVDFIATEDDGDVFANSN